MYLSGLGFIGQKSSKFYILGRYLVSYIISHTCKLDFEHFIWLMQFWKIEKAWLCTWLAGRAARLAGYLFKILIFSFSALLRNHLGYVPDQCGATCYIRVCLVFNLPIFQFLLYYETTWDTYQINAVPHATVEFCVLANGHGTMDVLGAVPPWLSNEFQVCLFPLFLLL